MKQQWAGHDAWMEETQNLYRILVGKSGTNWEGDGWVMLIWILENGVVRIGG
jgi:hypothetical protein